MHPNVKKAPSLSINLASVFTAICLLFVTAHDVKGQVAITQVAFPSGGALDVSDYPKIRARIKVTNGPATVSVAPTNTFIIEDNITFSPAKVTAESQGVYTVEWVTSLFESFGGVDQPTRLSYASTLLVFDQGSTGTTNFSTTLSIQKGARVVVRDSAGRNVPLFLDFGNVPIDSSFVMRLKIVATETAKSGSPQQERPVMLESITTRNNQFKVYWNSSYGTPAPPVSITSPFEYRIDVVFTAKSDEPVTDVLTVMYEGGMRTDIILSANPQVYPRVAILNITSPNGGEVFAPCQEIPVKWKGAVPGFQSYVEYTLDNGTNWMFVDSTLDSTIIWKAPQGISDNVRVKVYQKFQSTDVVWLNGERAQATCAGFSADGKYVLVGYSNGNLVEFDVTTNTRVNTYRLNVPSGTRVNAVAYIGSSRDFTAALTKFSGGGTLQYYSQGSASASAQTEIPTDIIVNSIGADLKGQVLSVLPDRSGRVLRFDVPALTPRSSIILSGPAETSSINNNKINIIQFDGFIVQYNAESGSEISRIQTNLPDFHGPIIKRTGASVNGNLTALGGRASLVSNGPREQRTFIYDMQTQRAVKILYRQSTDPVDLTFSPNNAFLGLGYRFSPQFLIYDLLAGKTLPIGGSPEGHIGELSSLVFSPVGTTIISTSLDSTKNTLLRKVNTPESDVSDNVFRIVPVQLSSSLHVLRTLLIGTSETVAISDICNTGEAPAIIERIKLKSGKWLTLTAPSQTDTVLPGDCLQLSFTVFPKDTGYLYDTLEISTCGATHLIPFSMYSFDRDLTVLFDIEDFGEVCIGDRAVRKLNVLRNNDSIPVVINAVFVTTGLASQFRIVSPIIDSVVEANGTLSVEVEFVPRKLGYDTSVVAIRYADQNSLARQVSVMGRGAGADLAFSHADLAFIPELPERSLIVHNNSDNVISIDSSAITPNEPFELGTSLPLEIQPHDSATIIVRYLGGAVATDAKVAFAVAPCANLSIASDAYKVRLKLYSGSTSLTYPVVVSAPTNDTASIPILASIFENVKYDGVRFFEATLRVHPRLFLANSVVSAVGNGEILSQNIINNIREIRFRIDGNFTSGEIGRIVGYAGMAEVDSSLLTFDTSDVAFGSSVGVTYRSGLLKIIHEDPVRRVVDRTFAPVISRIAPQPASDNAKVVINGETGNETLVSVVDRNGVVVNTFQLKATYAGGASMERVFTLDVSELPTGLYVVRLNTGNWVASSPLIVIH